MKKMIMNAKASLAMLLALLLLCSMIPVGGLMAAAADPNVIFADDFEDVEVGTTGRWTPSDTMQAQVKGSVGKDFSKGLQIGDGSGKWSTLTYYFTAEAYTDYEISYDYCESTVAETVQVQVRLAEQSVTLYSSDPLESTGGMWKHFTGTFSTEEITNLRLLVVTDGVLGANDKAFDNFVIRKVEEPIEYGKTVFSDDFESTTAGTVGQWENAQRIISEVKEGVGKDFSKGMVVNGPKWSRTRIALTLEPYTTYEISYDYYESTTTQNSRVSVRAKDVSPIVDAYASEPQGNTKGLWEHYTGTFHTDDITVWWLMIQTDENVENSDKTYDNFVIRKVDATVDATVVYDDFESGNLDQWSPSSAMQAQVKGSVGKDFSKGLQISEGSGKWSTITHYFNAEGDAYYEIDFDYYESTESETVQVLVRSDETDNFYSTGRLGNTGGMWQHYNGTFYIGKNQTRIRLVIVTDGIIGANDKTFDNFVIRKMSAPPDDGDDNKPVLTNGDFETGDFSNWEGAGANMAVITENVHGGSYAAKVTGGQWAGIGQYVDVTPDTDYKLTFWARYESGSNSQGCYIMDGKATKNLFVYDVKPGKTAGWIKYEYVLNSGDQTKLLISFKVTSSKEATLVYDDITFAPLGEVQFDGFLYNGSFETGDKAKWDGGGAFDIVTDAYDGTYAIHVKGDNYANIGQSVPTEANTDYSVVLWAKKASGNGKFAVLYKDKNETKNVESFYIDPTDKWTKYVITFNTGEYPEGHILLMADNSQNTAYVDAVSMVKGKPISTNGLISNGDFETGDMTDWENVGSDSEVVSTDPQEGSYALALKGRQWSAVRQTIATIKNTEYKVSFYVKRVAGFNQIALWLKNGDNNLVDPAGEEIGLKFDVNVTDGWMKVEHIFNSYDQTSVDVLFGMMDNGDEVLIDAIYVEKYVKPDVMPLKLTSMWAANNRPRTEAANLIVNGGFESQEGAQWNTGTFLGQDVSVVQSSDAREGEKMLYFNSSASNVDTKYVFWVSVEPDTNYTFSAFVKGAYWSAQNQCTATFGVVDPDTETFMIYPDERGKNSKDDYQLVPPSWDNEWHLRSVSFNSGEKKTVGIAVYGCGSQMYLDSMALYKNTESAKYTDPRNVGLITTTIDTEYAGCAPEDNLVGNFNMEADVDDFWSTGYGWKNDFIGICESETGYRNSLHYVESATPVGVRYIKWIDVKPNTNYTFSANLLVQADGEGCLELLDSKTTKPSPFVMLTFNRDIFGEDWIQYCLNFNTGLYDRIGICILDKGGEALIDNIRIFETDKGIDVEDEYIQNGWVEKDNKWYYYENNTMVKSTWKKDSIGWCYLGDQGYMLTNKWIRDSVGWCYVGADGYCVTNKWVADSQGWCYLDGNGRMVTNKWVKDSVGWCYVGADGYCITNKWVADSQGWCYLDENGRMATNKWIKDSKGWCYVGADGYCVTNKWVADSQGWCYLDGSGRMVTNKWVKDSVGWCYIGADGYCVTDNWIQDSTGGWCYLDSNGRMVYDTWVAGNYVDANGYWVIEMSNL